MRKELDHILTKLADHDSSLVLIVSDLGSFRGFRTAHPDRFYNSGVAEQNAAGMAAGMASEGKRVILFTVAGFSIYRAFEQIKFSIGYWNQPVCVVGTGFGWNFYQIGRGHHAPDDIALMSLVPNMEVFTPINASHLPAILDKVKQSPSYLRLGLGLDTGMDLQSKGSGEDLLVVALGEMAQRVSSAVSFLCKEGLDVGLIGLEQFNLRSVRESIGATKRKHRIFVVEDHIKMGGLGMLIQQAGYKVDGHLYLPLNVEKVTTTEDGLLQFYGFDEHNLIHLFRKCISAKDSK